MITSATSIAEAVPLAHIVTSSRPTMWQVVTVAKITVFTALESPRINPRIFLFLFEKHLTSTPGCGIIMAGKAGPGRRPGTEFPIGPPICNFFGGKCGPSICHQFPGNPTRRSVLVCPIGSHIWPHCGPKLLFHMLAEHMKTPLHMPLACL
jgi:hypothetical protein